jgi:tetratricopeptide (TPR) repeat protein
MSGLLLIVFSAVSTIGQAPWLNLTRLANQRQNADDFPAAEALRRQALQLAEKQLGPHDKQLAHLLTDLSYSLHYAARDAEAEPLMRRALEIARESGDPKLTGMTLNVLGIVLSGEGQRARAEPVLRRSVALLEESEGAGSLYVAKASNNLATLYLDTHQFAKGEEAMARALPIYEQHLRPDDPELALVLANMFTILAAQHRADQGEPYLRQALAIGEKQFPNTTRMANLQLCLASLEVSRDHLKDAALLLEKVIATQERVLGPEHRDVGRSLAAYSTVLRRMHQKNEAKLALNRANMILKTSLNDVK